MQNKNRSTTEYIENVDVKLCSIRFHLDMACQLSDQLTQDIWRYRDHKKGPVPSPTRHAHDISFKEDTLF